ncbi:MAG: energy transducer TonB [Candidatus Kapaibacterium sp.]
MQDNIFRSESYGGIEIRQNARKNTLMGFFYSVALHAILILLYVGWTWISSEDKDRISFNGRSIALIDISPPPSTSRDIALPPPTAMSAAMPKFGIPVSVPDVQAPNQILPENNIPGDQNSTPGTAIGIPDGTGTHADVPPVKAILANRPDPSIFVSVDEDPKPTQNIQELVQYPDQAKRSNLEGKVSYSALIGIDGSVKAVIIDKSDYEVFKQPVIDALMKTRFTPARIDQNPVEVYYSGTISFKIH